MTQFDWQTEDDLDWQDESPQPDSPNRGRWPRVVMVLLGIVAVGVAGWFGYARLQSTAAEVAETTDSEIRATAQLLFQSAESADIDIFNALLSGRDREWTSIQQRLVGDNGLLQREKFGLTLENTQPSFGDIELSPDLLSAETVANVEYSIHVGNGVTETVVLQQPFIFRKGSTRWLYAPPESPAQYWGGVAQIETKTFKTLAPNRDEELVQRIVNDLELLKSQLCDPSRQLNCPDNLQTGVIFSTQLEDFIDLRQQPNDDLRATSVTVPTPSLVGLPLDETSYNALLNGYADHILTPLIFDLTGYRCCERVPFVRALLDWVFVDLGIMAPPLTPTDYTELYDNVPALQDHLSFGWRERDMGEVSAEQMQKAYALTQFTRETYGQNVPLSTMLSSLSQADSFVLWSQLVAQENDPAFSLTYETWQRSVRQDWSRFIGLRGAPNISAAPISPPAYDIVATCPHPENLNSSVVLRHQLGTDNWDEVYVSADMELPVAISLPDASGYWLQQTAFISNRERSVMLRGDVEVVFDASNNTADAPNNLAPNYFAYGHAESKEMLVMLEDGPNYRYGLIKYESCTNEGGCNIAEIESIPIWTGSDKYTVLFSAEYDAPAMVLNANGDIVRTIDYDREISVPWIGQDVVVWIGSDDTIYSYNLETDSEQIVATVDDIRALLPDVYSTVNFEVSMGLFLNAQFEQATFFLLYAGDSFPILSYSPATQQLEYLTALENPAISVSSDGRFFMAPKSDSRLVVYDSDQDVSFDYDIAYHSRFSFPTWAPDGDWFMQMDNGILKLASSSTKFYLPLFPPLANCTAAAWVARP